MTFEVGLERAGVTEFFPNISWPVDLTT